MLKGFEFIIAVNTLADNAFKHQITLSDKIVPSITVPVPYVFNSSTDSQYNNTEFKGLLINLNVSTQLINSIC